MRAVLQRVTKGSVSVSESRVGQIGPGLVILMGVKTGDSIEDARWMAHKIANLRIFSDTDGKFNLSILDVGGEALVISQFTLYANARKGRRPSFEKAAHPTVAKPILEHFIQCLRQTGIKRVATGTFGAMMLVEICNDGPVTIMLDTDVTRRGNRRNAADS